MNRQFAEGALFTAGLALVAWAAYHSWAKERALRMSAENRAALAESNIWAPLPPAPVAAAVQQ